jgi:RimJ/RimL family protein N-acetyltransferase
VDPDNEKSIGLLEKFNFVREGYLKESYYFRRKFMDTGIYSLLRPEK